MPDVRPPTAFTLWLEEALTGWILPVAALALAGVSAGLYYVGLLPEGPTGTVLALLVALVAALFMVRPALSAVVTPSTRALAVAVAALVAVVCAWPAISAVMPGEPLAQGDLEHLGDTLALPSGVEGRIRLLVHVPLPAAGTPQVDFRLGGGAGPLEGRVERMLSYARAGRGGRTAVTHDRNETWVHGQVAGAAVTLERVTGQADGPLRVAVYRDSLPPLVLWLLSAVALLASAFLEARLGRGNAAPLAGMALTFSLLVALNATPASAVGTSLRAVPLGAIGGAIAGGLAGWLVKLGPWRPEATTGARGRQRPA